MRGVLILTNTKDTSTDLVVEQLRKRDVAYLRLNTDIAHEFLFSFNINSFTFAGASKGRHDMFSEIGAIYVRRPDPPHLEFDGYKEAISFTEFVENQWRALFRGLLSLTATWINPIPTALAAESKILQLRLARQIGLSVPETLVTNSIDDVRCFVRTHRHFVAKALDAPLVETLHGSDFVYTQLFDSQMFDVDRYVSSTCRFNS